MSSSSPPVDPLKALHAELSAIEYEERPSFAPELEAELASEWGRCTKQGPAKQGIVGLLRRWVEVVTRSPIALGVALLAVVAFGFVTPVREAALSRFAFSGTAPVEIPDEAGLARHGVPVLPDTSTDTSQGEEGEWDRVGGLEAGAFLGALYSVRSSFTAQDPLDLLAPALAAADPSGNLGPVANVLTGTPPPKVATTPWRVAAGAVLERILADEPENAAPALALARLRLKQGLRGEAVSLLDVGLSRTVAHPHRASSPLVADLLHERGLLLRDSWYSRVSLGVVPLSELDPGLCPAAPSMAELPGGWSGAPIRALVAWNYLCPNEFARVISDGFEFTEPEAARDGDLMLEVFRAAAEIEPRHVGANVHHLLPLSDQRRWNALLGGANSFLAASGGHPYGHLLAGLALHRLGLTPDARKRFDRALEGLADSEAEAIRDVGFLVEDAQLAEYRRMSDAERVEWEAGFWSELDPDPATAVNEREVEHLARATQVLLRFGDLGCDAAEVWIRYGRPSDIRVVGDPDGLITEFWDYRVGADATFVRLGPGIPPTLTSEGKAYLDDLREVLPHYGTVQGYE